MNYIKGFDGLRAISIIMVFLTHLGVMESIDSNDFMTNRFAPLFSGGTGVNIFFVISGFLITRILLLEKAKTGKIKIKRFFIRRFLRLLPALLIFYIILLSLMLTKQVDTNFIGITFSIFYIYNFVPRMYYTGELGPTWSLAVEEQFYLFWPFIISFVKRSKVILIATLLLLLCIISYSVYPTIFIEWGAKKTQLTEFTFTQRWFIPAIGSIMMGALTAIRFDTFKSSYIFNKWKYFVPFLALVLMINTLYVPFWMLTYSSLIHASGTCLLLSWIVINQNSLLTQILEFPVLRYVGRISYGLYVYHGLFIRTSPTGELFIQKFPQNLILTLCLAILSYHLIEKNILKLKNRFD